MWHLSYRPEVEDDVFDTVTWYDDKRPGLEGVHQGDLANAICSVIAEAGKQLSGPLPRAEGDVNELQNTLVLID